jgi:hypothetical protein
MNAAGVNTVQSRRLRQPSLLLGFIGGVTGFDAVVDGEVAVVYGAEPDFVIARPWSDQ